VLCMYVNGSYKRQEDRSSFFCMYTRNESYGNLFLKESTPPIK